MLFLLRPDPEVLRQNKTLVELVLMQRDSDKAPSKRKVLAEELLALDTGPWGDENHIWHHCKGANCCQNGIVETRGKIWCAVVAL